MLQENLENKVAIVTGGTRGIGRAIAARLLSDGARVAVCGSRQKSVDDALDLLAPAERIMGMVADVSKLEDVRSFIGAVKQRFGTVDILVNNAGAGVFRSVADLTPEEWQHMIGLNLTGAYYCCHEILPIFRQNGGGDVVNISSLAGEARFCRWRRIQRLQIRLGRLFRSHDARSPQRGRAGLDNPARKRRYRIR